MEIGIVSDTHGRVPMSLHEAFSRVDEILHCGDICDDGVLAEIEAIAPVTAVHGNCDRRPLVERLPEERRIERAGVRIGIVHGHRFRRGSVDDLAAHFGNDADLVLFGHSHVAHDETRGATRFFNPGTAGGIGARATAGLLVIEDGGWRLRGVAL